MVHVLEFVFYSSFFFYNIVILFDLAHNFNYQQKTTQTANKHRKQLQNNR